MPYLKTITIALALLVITATNCLAAKRPNILYIMSDDHAADGISAYGSRLAKVAPTPNIDRLAKEGALFTNAFCTNSICSPSRACVLT
ncbi:MAG: sulfatase-like hydrolase/transferase, partial [Planctomycetaceae bacterium]|nr:sulfatase-like hydrolase/transferase [Planctomycetaceae bacterium]